MGRKAEAWEALKTVLDFHPFSASAHGLIFEWIQKEKPAEALMAGCLSVVFEDDREKALGRLGLLDNFAAQMNAGSIAQTDLEPKDNFGAINQLLNSKVALKAEYPWNSQWNYPLMRQTGLLVDQIRQETPGTGYFSQEYLPFYRESLQQKEDLELFFDWLMWPVESKDALKARERLNKNADRIRSWLDTWAEQHRHCTPLDTAVGIKVLILKDLNFWGYGGEPESSALEWCRVFSDAGDMESQGYARGRLWEGTWTYFDSGVKRGERNFKNDLLEGQRIDYHPDGTVQFKANFERDSIHGIAQWFAPNGWILEDAEFRRGTRQGAAREYHPNGQVLRKSHYDKGLLDGQMQEYSWSGVLVLEGSFESGVPAGIWKSYFPNGKLRREVAFREGQFEGRVTDCNIMGHPVRRTPYVQGLREGADSTFNHYGGLVLVEHYRKDLFHGHTLYYTDEGRLCGQLEYKNGLPQKGTAWDAAGRTEGTFFSWNKKVGQYEPLPWLRDNTAGRGRVNAEGLKQGLWTFYDYYGNKVSALNYEKGNREGVAYFYYKDGTLAAAETYARDTLHGLSVGYFNEPGQRVSSEVVYVRGQRHGPAHYYERDGSLGGIENYRNGRLHGSSRVYYSNGALYQRSWYEGGVMVANRYFGANGTPWGTDSNVPVNGTMTYRYPKGQVYRTVHYKNRLIEGQDLYYYPWGALQSKQHFSGGIRHGLAQSWHPSGAKKDSILFFEGLFHGQIKEWSMMGSLSYEAGYELGQIHGISRNYNSTGRLYVEKQWHLGEETGYTRYFSQQGALQGALWYNRGYIVGWSSASRANNAEPEHLVSNPDGRVEVLYNQSDTSLCGPLEDALKQGTHRYFAPGGRLERRVAMNRDVVSGAEIWYDAQGKVVSEEQHLPNGQLHGPVKCFSSTGAVLFSTEYCEDELCGWGECSELIGGQKPLRTRWFAQNGIVQPE
ncbi:hypothetical protein GC167_09020 [bacterium]|nr:hypothetical protein [bacterium]